MVNASIKIYHWRASVKVAMLATDRSNHLMDLMLVNVNSQNPRPTNLTPQPLVFRHFSPSRNGQLYLGQHYDDCEAWYELTKTH